MQPLICVDAMLGSLAGPALGFWRHRAADYLAGEIRVVSCCGLNVELSAFRLPVGVLIPSSLFLGLEIDKSLYVSSIGVSFQFS